MTFDYTYWSSLIGGATPTSNSVGIRNISSPFPASSGIIGLNTMNGPTPTVYVSGTGIILASTTSGTLNVGGTNYPAVTDDKGNIWGLWFNGGTSISRWSGQGSLYTLSSNTGSNATSINTANIAQGSMVGYGIGCSTSLSFADIFSVYTDSSGSTAVSNIQAFFNNSSNGITSSGSASSISVGSYVSQAIFRPPAGTTRVLIGGIPQYGSDVGYGMFDISTSSNTLIGKFMRPTVATAGALGTNPNNSNIIVGVWSYSSTNYAFVASENSGSTTGIAYVLIG